MRKLIVLVALALAAVPAALANNGSPSSPAQRCAAQRTLMGTSAFNQLYGTPAGHLNAFGKCVSKLTHADEANAGTAAAACRSEQADANFAASHGDKTFAQFYGANGNGRNAFGRCVSQKARAAAGQQQQTTINAARACRTEQLAGPAAFKAKYGTNTNKSNAFGKCVAQKTHS